MTEDRTQHRAASPPFQPYPPRLRSWGVLVLFCIASIVSVIDRGILTLVVQPVRAELGITDLQVSLLQGLSFGIFYAVMGIPLGLLADRVSRKRLLMFGIVVWSLATLYGAEASSFAELFAARLLVGLGEAALAPCAISMIGDMFPAHQRGRPISVYLLGQAVAPGIGLFLTAKVLAAAPTGVFDHLPLLGGLAPWRLVFAICGLIGLVVAALMLVYREPVRRSAVAPQGAKGIGAGFGEAFGYLKRNWLVFVPFYVGFAVAVMHTYGLSGWNATYLIRTFERTPVEVGEWLGTAAMICGAAGALSAGWINDRAAALAQAGRPDIKLRLLMILCCVALPSTLLAFAPSFPVGLAMVALSIAVMPMLGTTMISSITELVPGNMRGVATSMLGLTNTLLGATMGPLLIAFSTEHIYRDPALIGASMTTVGLPVIALGLVLYGLAAKGMAKRLADDAEFRAVVTGRA
ncbi:MFS transporter [Novosphingobium resinovorum]|uniref:MFS transporter n=1 Tax=Novosphingobium resinovorum TaxID=158500 RepID=UPI002ED0C11A|nr:MFS transporter [Novosphingobium resinovorum]